MDKGKLDEIMERISNFVEEIRIETSQHTNSPLRNKFFAEANNENKASTSSGGEMGAVEEDYPVEPIENDNMIEARKLVVNSETHKATVEPPARGKLIEQFDKLQAPPDDMDDDQFFHLTCHVDNSLKEKIEQGEFVNLERLLPKKRSFSNEEGRLEWTTKDGMTFLTPVQDKETKINSFKKWDQAFRVYAAIYCNANPSRSGEVWQYIHTIFSASVSYQWDNVSYYDTVFRQMMAERPRRSWSKTYMQLWQLALRDRIPNSTNVAHSQMSSSGAKQNSNNSNDGKTRS